MHAVHSGAGVKVSLLSSQLPICIKPSRVFLLLWKFNKHLSVQNSAFPRAFFAIWLPVVDALHDSHKLETLPSLISLLQEQKHLHKALHNTGMAAAGAGC